MNFDALPGEWRTGSLAEIGHATVAKLDPRAFPEELFEYYSIPAFQKGASATLTAGAEILSHKLLIPPRCVLFGKLNPRVEKVWNVRSTGGHRRLASTEWLTLLPTDGVDQDFLYFLMYSEWVMPIAKTLVSGSTPSRQRVNEKAFFDIRVPLPGIREQRRLAYILRLVHGALGTCRSAITAGTALRAEAMRTLFTRGLRGQPTKETEIGPMPEEWEVVRVPDVVSPYRFDGKKQVPRSRYRPTGQWPIIDQGQNEIAGYTDSDSAALHPDVPIIVFGDHTRMFKYVDHPFAVGAQGTRLLRAVDSYDSRYVYYAFCGLSLEDRGYNRHTKVLMEARIPRPGVREQREIVAILDTIARKIDLHRRKQEVLEQLFRTLLHDLMTGRVRVDDLDLSTVVAGQSQTPGE